MSFAVLCPGQGHQHAAMLDLADASDAARDVLRAGERALGLDFVRALHEDARFVNRVAQPLVCIAQLAVWRAIRDRVPEPAAIAGYSAGELASYGCAGALDANALATLARARADAMDAALSAKASALVAVRGARRAQLRAYCEGRELWIAIVIGVDRHVLGGAAAEIDAVRGGALGAGVETTPLSVSVASHTPLLRSAVEPFARALAESRLRDPAIATIAGIDAAFVRTRDVAIDRLARQLAQPIEWSRCLEALDERGCRVFLELPPGNALTRIAREALPHIEARAVEDFRSLDAVVEWVLRRIE